MKLPRIRIRLDNTVRVAEVAIIAVMGTILLVTYRELTVLRQVPVALPNYEFEIIGPPEHPNSIQTRGTWIAQRGPREPLQTTTIECRKSTMACVESAAVIVFVGDKGVMESAQTTFEIESWGDTTVSTKPVRGRCTERRLTLDLAEKRALARVSASRDDGKCTEAPEKSLELVAGYKVRAEALQKAKMF